MAPVEVLKWLVQKSSRQFIYASTVAKYVSSIHHQPTDCLNIILGIRPPRHVREMPFGELDALYMHIFTAVEHIETVLLILGLYLLRGWYIYPCMDIGDLEHFFLMSRGKIDLLFGDLSSLVFISNVEPYIHLLHASLRNFLHDPAQSKEFYIDLSNIHTTCMPLGFHHIKQCMSSYLSSKEFAEYPRLIDSTPNNHSAHIIYAGQNLLWAYGTAKILHHLHLCNFMKK